MKNKKSHFTKIRTYKFSMLTPLVTKGVWVRRLNQWSAQRHYSSRLQTSEHLNWIEISGIDIRNNKIILRTRMWWVGLWQRCNDAMIWWCNGWCNMKRKPPALKYVLSWRVRSSSFMPAFSSAIRATRRRRYTSASVSFRLLSLRIGEFTFQQRNKEAPEGYVWR